MMDTVPLFNMMYGFQVLDPHAYNTKKHEDEAMVKRDLMGCGQPGTLQITTGLYNFLSQQPDRNDPEEAIFYYHGDHLGSTSYITDISGMPSQHIDYLPFGEPLLEEKTQTWQSPYKFNCKEQDEESGLFYYGARYYDPRTSVFYGVDPLTEKRPWESPFTYCGNNPIVRIDPNGMIWKDTDGNTISDDDQKKVKVYIFYNPKAFGKQSMKMAQAAEKKYGKGSVALSDVTTENEFAEDWKNMGGNDIKEVDINVSIRRDAYC